MNPSRQLEWLIQFSPATARAAPIGGSKSRYRAGSSCNPFSGMGTWSAFSPGCSRAFRVDDEPSVRYLANHLRCPLALDDQKPLLGSSTPKPTFAEGFPQRGRTPTRFRHTPHARLGNPNGSGSVFKRFTGCRGGTCNQSNRGSPNLNRQQPCRTDHVASTEPLAPWITQLLHCTAA